VREVLRETLGVLWRECIERASLAVEHPHNEELLALTDNDILAKLLGYFIEVHEG
jgi:hypothetical protein